MEAMAARHDILDRPESMKNPVVSSIVLHGALAGFMALWGNLPIDSVIQWGDPDSIGGGPVTITPVSKIPMPPRAGQVNPVANPTESQVPAAPPEVKPKPVPAAKPAPDAVKIPSRKPAKKAPARQSRRRRRTRPGPQQNNQLYSSTGAALTSPMMGSTKGGGGVGVGSGNPMGSRFGYYVDIVRRKVAENWDTGQVDPGLQTAPTVIVSFVIQRNGTARDVVFLQRSGHSSLDFSAQRAVIDASPFPPLPAGFERNSVKVEFWFQLQR